MAIATPVGTIGGEAAWLLTVSWATTGAAAICFLLRLYTRLVVAKQYGWDDNIYNASFVSPLGTHARNGLAAWPK